MQTLLLEQQNNKTLAPVQTLDKSHLPEGNVAVDIHQSSLNYKDALAIAGEGKTIRNFPMIPGVDFAGTVRASEGPRFHAGQEVLLTGWGVGENRWGGLTERARVKGDWPVAMPRRLGARKTMIIGTAGFTAMLCVMALEDAGIRPQDEEIVMTDASGSVGSTAMMLLHKLGYQIVAISGHGSTHGYLEGLGASRVLPHDRFAESRPLKKQVWVGAIDTISDKVLAKVSARINYGGCVATYGLAGGFTLPIAVIPFILRNVRSQGMDSVMTPPEHRAQAWRRLVADLPESPCTQAAREISLSGAPSFAEAVINSQIQGHTLVKIN